MLLENTAMRVLLPVSPPDRFRVPTLRMLVIESDSKPREFYALTVARMQISTPIETSLPLRDLTSILTEV